MDFQKNITKTNRKADLALYFHWPFCEKKCPYCDFNSHVREEISNQNYLQKYLKIIEHYAEALDQRTVNSIFFGGGTPSLMQANDIEQILNSVFKSFKTSENIEISIEANPASSEAKKFQDFRKAGINRLSIGIQSFKDESLKFLGRKHNSAEAKNAIELAKKYFDNFSFDLIYALPNQTLSDWQEELKTAMDFGSPHISLYQLTIEKGTEFYSLYNKGKIELPEEDLANDLYFHTAEFLKDFGLKQYEISNYAKDGFECEHNLNYWKYNDYLGIGAGAHSRLKSKNEIFAFYETHSPENWLKEEQNFPPIQKFENLSEEEILQEVLFMGLRRKEGINLSRFNGYFKDEISEKMNQNKLKLLKDEGLIKLKNDQTIKLTQKGYSLHTAICREILEF